MWIDTLQSLALLFAVVNNGLLQLVESASVRLTKSCYNIGESITPRFVNVQGEGIFVGLYPDADVPNRERLPALDSPSLKNWVLTCGRHNNCEAWPSQGLVELHTDGLEEDDYIIAISGNRSGLVPQAVTGPFHVGNCPTFFSFPEVAPNAPGPITTTEVESLTETLAIQPIVPTSAPIGLTPTSVPVQIVSTPQSVPAQDSIRVVSDSINSVIDDARINIENLIRNDGDLTGKVSSAFNEEKITP